MKNRHNFKSDPFMKMKMVIAGLFVVSITGLARMLSLFSNWDNVQRESTSIVIVRCGRPVPLNLHQLIGDPPRYDSEVEVVSVLKGTNTTGAVRLWTDHIVHQGENYLVFGTFENGIYRAFEEFKVLPLGPQFSPNSIAGKSLDDQIQILFKNSLFIVNRELQQDQEQKAQLESRITKP